MPTAAATRRQYSTQILECLIAHRVDVHRHPVDHIVERLPRQVERRDERLQATALVGCRPRPVVTTRQLRSPEATASRADAPPAADASVSSTESSTARQKSHTAMIARRSRRAARETNSRSWSCVPSRRSPPSHGPPEQRRHIPSPSVGRRRAHGRASRSTPSRMRAPPSQVSSAPCRAGPRPRHTPPVRTQTGTGELRRRAPARRPIRRHATSGEIVFARAARRSTSRGT